MSEPTIYQKANSDMAILQKLFCEKNYTPLLLAIDDEPQYRELIKRWIMPLNWFIELACSGEEALKMLKHTNVDLIWVDIKMPGMSGIQFVSEVKACESCIGKHCPIIVVTGVDITGEVKALLNELDVFIIAAKPRNAVEFISLLERANPMTSKTKKL